MYMFHKGRKKRKAQDAADEQRRIAEAAAAKLRADEVARENNRERAVINTTLRP